MKVYFLKSMEHICKYNLPTQLDPCGEVENFSTRQTWDGLKKNIPTQLMHNPKCNIEIISNNWTLNGLGFNKHSNPKKNFLTMGKVFLD